MTPARSIRRRPTRQEVDAAEAARQVRTATINNLVFPWGTTVSERARIAKHLWEGRLWETLPQRVQKKFKAPTNDGRICLRVDDYEPTFARRRPKVDEVPNAHE